MGRLARKRAARFVDAALPGPYASLSRGARETRAVAGQIAQRGAPTSHWGQTAQAKRLEEPLGFSLDERPLRRAGLGYWESLDVTRYRDWGDFVERNAIAVNDERLHLLTKKARHTYAEARYHDGDYLVFGCESAGLPESLLAANARRCERIPMLPDATSLENADRWRAQDGHADLLAQDVCGNFVNPDDYRISALNLSNAAAIVLYEALRQEGFPGM